MGILVLFVGIGSLLKIGVEQGWFSFPVEFRLAGIALSAIGGLVFGWVQREKRRAFALSVQGGAIGILLMTVFAAFKFYDLIAATPALVIAVVLVGASGILAVTQRSSALAVLSLLAGFLAPLMLSSGSGNYVALFSYYAVLNLGILAMSYWRTWPWLNLLGFLFTFGIGIIWGGFEYTPDKAATTLPFVGIFFAQFLLIPILNQRRNDTNSLGFVDTCLIFGNPIISYFSLTMILTEVGEVSKALQLGYAAFGIAALYALLATGFTRLESFKNLGYNFAGLAFGFATLAVPLAFSAQVTVGVFALQGLAMIWLGLRNKSLLQQFVGPVMFGLAALFFLFGVDHEAALSILNSTFMGGMLIAFAGFGAAFLNHHHKSYAMASLYFFWALAFWLGTGIHEIFEFVPANSQNNGVMAFSALTIALLAAVHFFVPASVLSWAIALGYASMLGLAIIGEGQTHAFEGNGLYVWLAYAVLGMGGLFSLSKSDSDACGWAHSAWVFSWAFAFSTWFVDLAETSQMGEGWVLAAGFLPWLAVSTAVYFLPRGIGQPFANFQTWRGFLMFASQLWLGFLWLVALTDAGASAPLPWIPLLNPLELTLMAIMGITIAWLSSDLVVKELRDLRAPIIAGMVFFTVTNLTLRSVHHIGMVPWGSAMWDSAAAQSSLTIVWSILGVIHWVIGSKRKSQALWAFGAFLMAVVLVKLIFIDRHHLGDLMGVGSTIAYGLLCVIIGFLAPAPQNSKMEQPPAEPREEDV